MCFELAKKHGINSMVLNMTVESRKVREMNLSGEDGR
jgi:hypothetical protein